MQGKNKIILASDIHYHCGDFFGVDPDEIMERLCADLAAEYAKQPYTALLLLGDYSLDHWAWQTKGTYLTKGISNASLFAQKYLERIAPSGVELRMIAGNHEQYGEALWQELTGYNRRDHIVIGDILFILTDTFGGDLDPAEHSDGTYIGANVADIKTLMETYPDKRVIICSHWFDITKESEEFCQLLRDEERILCLFCGHNHKSHVVSTGEENGNKPILCTGHYSYSGEPNNLRCMPGYRVLEWDTESLCSRYVVPSHTYRIGAVSFTTEYAEQDVLEIEL